MGNIISHLHFVLSGTFQKKGKLVKWAIRAKEIEINLLVCHSFWNV
jgi:hypothetical protein